MRCRGPIVEFGRCRSYCMCAEVVVLCVVVLMVDEMVRMLWGDPRDDDGRGGLKLVGGD